MKRNFLTVLMTGVLILVSHSPAALADSKDERFLGIIGTAVEDSNSDVQAVAKSHDDDARVAIGQTLCEALSQEKGDPDQVIQKMLLSDSDFQKLESNVQNAQAYYFGIVLAAASYTYCPEYKEAVETWSQQK